MMRALATGILLMWCACVTSLRADIMVPLPPAPDNVTVTAHDAYAEVFLQNITQQTLNLPGGMPLEPGQAISNVAIGYTTNDGTGQPSFVLYTGGQATTSSTVKPNQVLAYDPTGSAISDLFSGEYGTVGRLFVMARIQTIRNTTPPDTQIISYSLGPADTNTNPQLTVTLSNATIMHLALTPGPVSPTRAGTITTLLTLSSEPDEQLHVDVYADATPDAAVRPVDPAAQRIRPVVPTVDTASGVARPELPLRGPAPVAGMVGDQPNQLYAGLNDGTYYDRSTGRVWKDLAFAGDPNDDDELMWSFVANPEATFGIQETFIVNAATAESFTATRMVDEGGEQVAHEVEVFIAGSSQLLPEISLEGTLTPGPSLSPKAQLQAGLGYKGGFYNHLLVAGEDYTLSGAFLYGGILTGAYDSDPNTFSFQELPRGESTLLQIAGPVIPEPTVITLLLAGGTLLVVKRRHHSRPG